MGILPFAVRRMQMTNVSTMNLKLVQVKERSYFVLVIMVSMPTIVEIWKMSIDMDSRTYLYAYTYSL